MKPENVSKEPMWKCVVREASMAFVGGILDWKGSGSKFVARAKSDGGWSFTYKAHQPRAYQSPSAQRFGGDWVAECETSYGDVWYLAPSGLALKQSGNKFPFSSELQAKVACQRHYDNFGRQIANESTDRPENLYTRKPPGPLHYVKIHLTGAGLDYTTTQSFRGPSEKAILNKALIFANNLPAVKDRKGAGIPVTIDTDIVQYESVVRESSWQTGSRTVTPLWAGRPGPADGLEWVERWRPRAGEKCQTCGRPADYVIPRHNMSDLVVCWWDSPHPLNREHTKLLSPDR